MADNIVSGSVRRLGGLASADSASRARALHKKKRSDYLGNVLGFPASLQRHLGKRIADPGGVHRKLGFASGTAAR